MTAHEIITALISPANHYADELDSLADECESEAETETAAYYREQVKEIETAIAAAREYLKTMVA